ncbi:MAG: hypothetical protein QXU48_00375 [Thermoplasmata archaeon]
MGDLDRSKILLDKLGPYISGLAACVASIPAILVEAKIINGSIITDISILLTIFLPYLLSTCTHRKYSIHSAGGLGGLLGAIVGFWGGAFVSGLFLTLCYIFYLKGGAFRGHVVCPECFLYAALIHLVILFIFTFLFSRAMCRRWARKEKMVADISQKSLGYDLKRDRGQK